MPIIAPQPVLTAGEKVRSWFAKMGIESPRGGDLERPLVLGRRDPAGVPAHAALRRRLPRSGGQRAEPAQRAGRHADLAIWGEQDAIIPVQHAYAALEWRARIPASR